MRHIQKIIKVVKIPKDKENRTVIKWSDGTFIVTGESGIIFKNRVLMFGASKHGSPPKRYIAVNAFPVENPTLDDVKDILHKAGIKIITGDVVEGV